jgi:carboxypeptidase C (cathepsin A)
MCSTKLRHSTATLLFVTCSLTGASAHAQATTPDSVLVTTRHQVAVAGKTLRYRATAGVLPIANNDAGDVHGRMFFVAYTLEGPQPSRRPVTFLWNGGPGSSASQVHLLGFGPKRVKTADLYPTKPFLAGSGVEDNKETWLEHTDLVFVDPIGTGYSRPTKPEYASEFYNQRGDIESVAEFIRVYRARFDDEAPVFLAGESYGTTRAMGVAEALERRRTTVAGVILIGGFLELGQVMPPALTTALMVPRYTATAFFHKRLPADLQRDLPAALRESEAWARGAYANALARVDSVPPAERSTIVAQLARFSGADTTLVNARTLAIPPAMYTDRLLADRRLEIGRYDTRTSAPARNLESTPWEPTTDPSLRPVLDLMQGSSVDMIRYFRNDLKYKSDLLYQGPFGEGYPPSTAYRGDWMSQKWNRGGPATPDSAGRGAGRGAVGGRGQTPPAVPPLRQAMTINPRLRVLVVSGLYDTVVPTCATMDEIVARVDAQFRSRVEARCYAGGHMMYTDVGPRREIQRDVTRFLRETLAQPVQP